MMGLAMRQASPERRRQPGSAGLPLEFRLNEKTMACTSPKAKLAHDLVVEDSKADILGLKDPKWNKSTYVDKGKFSRHEAECKLSTTFGKKGHTIRDPDILWSRPALPGPWNVSTDINRKILHKTLEQSLKRDHENTLKRNAHLTGYVNPASALSPELRRTRSLSPTKGTHRCPEAESGNDLSPSPSKRKSRPPRKEDVEIVRMLDTWQPPAKPKLNEEGNAVPES